MGYLNVVGVSDNVAWLEQVASDSVDSCVTDSPYGLGEPPPILAVLMSWARGKDFVAEGAGFMGNEWDRFVPNPSLWRQVYRILKPGALLLSFFGSRTYDLGSVAIRVAGFEVLDTCMWLYGQGMPHGLDIAKALDKDMGHWRGRAGAVSSENRARGGPNYERTDKGKAVTDVAKRWEGWNTALKPAHEPIVIARKPFSGTYIENIVAHGTGAFNIDGARIATTENRARFNNARSGHGTSYQIQKEAAYIDPGGDGRYPANVVLAHDPGCKKLGTKRVKGTQGTAGGRMAGKSSEVYGKFAGSDRAGEPTGYVDADGYEEVDDWECVPDCPIRLIDAQSGVGKSGVAVLRNGGGQAIFAGLADGKNTRGPSPDHGFGDEGGASRFFYTAKASARERWSYCRRCKVVFQHTAADAFEEHEEHKKEVTSHPTQKPLDLMAYFVRLVTPPGGTVVEPFCGTGSTPVACKAGGFNFIACDIGEDYVKITEARLAAVALGASAKTGASYFCPGCKKKGEIKLIEKALVERMKADGKKVTCSKCMMRYSYEELAT